MNGLPNVVCIYSGPGSSWKRETETGENLCDSAECDSLLFFHIESAMQPYCDEWGLAPRASVSKDSLRGN